MWSGGWLTPLACLQFPPLFPMQPLLFRPALAPGRLLGRLLARIMAHVQCAPLFLRYPVHSLPLPRWSVTRPVMYTEDAARVPRRGPGQSAMPGLHRVRSTHEGHGTT